MALLNALSSFNLQGEEFSNYHEHWQAFAALKAQVEEREDRKEAAGQNKDIALLSTNIAHFLPEVPTEEYRDIYRNILLGRALLNIETDRSELIDAIDYSGLEIALDALHLPAIYCTYHLGSYRAIIGILARHGIDFNLLVDRRTAHTQGDDIRQRVKTFRKDFNTTGHFDIIEAEAQDCTMRMIQSLRKGISMVIYIDGNTGGGGIHHKSEKTMLRVPFLGQEIFARKGIATLSKLTKCPIIPVISYYKPDAFREPRVEFHAPIYPGKESTKEYVAKTTKELFRLFEHYLSQYYDQWETWMYIHKFLPPEGIKTHVFFPRSAKTSDWSADEPIVFGHPNYRLFKMDQDPFLFSSHDYKTYPINQELYDLLDRLSNPIPFSELQAECTPELLEDLASNGIIQSSKI